MPEKNVFFQYIYIILGTFVLSLGILFVGHRLKKKKKSVRTLLGFPNISKFVTFAHYIEVGL